MGSRSMTNTTTDDSGLIVRQNEDGTFQMEWNKNDPKWSFLNTFTSKEIQIIMEQAIKSSLDEALKEER